MHGGFEGRGPASETENGDLFSEMAQIDRKQMFAAADIPPDAEKGYGLWDHYYDWCLMTILEENSGISHKEAHELLLKEKNDNS